MLEDVAGIIITPLGESYSFGISDLALGDTNYKSHG